jgi:membrane protease YdiL (CAAX protease family)
MSDKVTVMPEAKKEKKHKFWGPVQTVLLTFAVYFVAVALIGIIFELIAAAMGWNAGQYRAWRAGAWGQFFLILAIEALVVGMVWGLVRLKKQSLTFIGLKWPTLKDLGLAIVAFFVYYLLFFIIAGAARISFPGINFEQEQQLGIETVRANWELILVFFSLAVFPPIAEEVLARGFLYTGLRTKLPIWAAAILTSAIFAAAHLQFDGNAPLLWVAAIDTFTLSLVLVYLRETTGSLGAPILLHMLKNSVAFTLLFILQIR